MPDLLGEADENSFGAPGAAHPISVFVRSHFAEKLRAAFAEPGAPSVRSTWTAANWNAERPRQHARRRIRSPPCETGQHGRLAGRLAHQLAVEAN